MRERVRVSQVMTDRWVVMDGLHTVEEGIDRLRGSGAEAILVEKREEGDEYGLVLLSDIGKRVMARDRAPSRVNLYEIMAKPVVGIPAQMDVRYCARLFERFGLAQAPVLEGARVVGWVSYADLVLKGAK